MAAELPYPNMDFVPLDTLTATEQDHLVANIEYTANYINENMPTITVSTEDIGEGQPLAANTLYFVVNA